MTETVSTRQEMADRLESVMTRSYEELKDELHLARNSSLLKTYIVEAHTTERSAHDELYKTLSKGFEGSFRRGTASIATRETQDEDLFVVDGRSRAGAFVFFIDTSDRRFWLAHALAKSEAADSVIGTVLSGSSMLDSAWMPIELLESVMTLGTSRGLGLDFDRRYIDQVSVRKKERSLGPDGHQSKDENPINIDTHLEYAKLQLWGNGANRILKALKDAKLTNSTTLSKVRLKNEDKEDSDLFALSDIKYDGKITGKGTSFDTYNSLIVAVRDKYAKAVRNTETEFRLSWEGDSDPVRKGEPFYISLGEYGVSNLEHFCAKVFSGAEPFRLMGLPIRRNANFYTASAVDLHVNQKIDFEISRSFFTAYLPKQACGNTLLRLYTNLQHYFSSDVKAVHGSGERVFSF